MAVGDVAADELDDADDAEAAAVAGAPAADDEDEGEDVHPAITAPSVTMAIAASGVVVRRSVISAIPLSVNQGLSDIKARIQAMHPLTYIP